MLPRPAMRGEGRVEGSQKVRDITGPGSKARWARHSRTLFVASGLSQRPRRRPARNNPRGQAPSTHSYRPRYRAIRIWNNDAIENLDGLLSKRACPNSKNSPSPSPLPASGAREIIGTAIPVLARGPASPAGYQRGVHVRNSGNPVFLNTGTDFIY